MTAEPRRPTSGDPITGYSFEARCPLCNAHLHHVASGTPGRETQALADCQPCGRTYKFALVMRDVTAEIPRPAAERNRRHRERQQAGAAT
ncbi:MAG TPA: hypothetical protein VGW74_08850 [Propionibacteriaceae bacterium]|nr:hypothetical protein [Propionibacteriaceae bacterium]